MATVVCAVVNNGAVVAEANTPESAFSQLNTDDGSFAWISVHQPNDEEIAHLVQAAGLPHHLGRSLAAERHSRRPHSSVLHHNGVTMFRIGTARYLSTHSKDLGNLIRLGHLLAIVTPRALITIGYGVGVDIAGAFARLRHDTRGRFTDPWRAAVAIVDTAQSAQDRVSDKLEDGVEAVEVQIMHNPRSDTRPVYQVKRAVVEFRRVVAPTQLVLTRIADDPIDDLDDQVQRLFQGCADHQRRLTERIAGFDDLLSSMLSVALAQIAVRQNDDMRKISAWAAIIGVLTTIAGIYGMNFTHMPELGWVIGYPLALLLMAGTSAVLYRAFRKSGWL